MLHAHFTTSEGSFRIRLFDEDVPNTVANFVGLAEGTKEFSDPKTGQKTTRPFYDGLIFHRVIADFMIQGGCPEGSGRGGPGYRFEDEVRNRENQRHFPGVISMANAGPGTNGSQFFITHVDCSYLDPKHTVFGKVTKGKDVVDSVKQGDKIESITITEA